MGAGSDPDLEGFDAWSVRANQIGRLKVQVDAWILLTYPSSLLTHATVGRKDGGLK